MKTALLIDQDEASRKLISRFLKREGWQVLQADTGERGIALALQHLPGMILCDLVLPDRSGLEVCRALRNHSGLSYARFIITSVRDHPSDRQGAMEAGAQAYLTKPVDVPLLRRMVEKVNLPEAYQVPQKRSPMIPKNEGTRLRFWGVRGSIPTPGAETVRYGGNTSCVEVRAGGELIIMDAGSGIRPLGLSLMQEFKGRPLDLTLLITHTHWDHIQGFPFFIPAYLPQTNMRILGYEGARQGLEETLAGQMESPYFPIGFKQMPGNIFIRELNDLCFEVGEIKLKAAYMHHPGICVGYRLFTREGSITYIPDNEPYLRMKSQRAEVEGNSTPELLDFARKQDEKLVEFIADSDVLIIDAQYDEQEYLSHVGWGHSCMDDSVNLAIKGGVKRLFLFHHDPTHGDAKIDSMVSHARRLVAKAGSQMHVEAASEGIEVRLDGKPRKARRPSKRCRTS